MERRDHHGLAYSGASSAALDKYLKALAGYYCYVGDPVTLLEEALADSPQFVMGHALKAWICLVGSNLDTVSVARAAWEQAILLEMNDRERGHLRAIELMLDNEIWAAARVMEDVSIAFPRDALALQVGQLMDFLVGDSRMLRDRIGRAMPAWSRDVPDYHAVLGMAAFGLEETGQYARAEATGLEALSLEPRNTWATHAVAHVMEMQNRRREGVAFMRLHEQDWATDSFFSVHNWWHLSLFHLGLGEVDEVLKLYDGPIYGASSAMQFDMVDASALLWRLHLKGVDVGGRWQGVADAWQADMKGSAGQYPFSDLHAMMAFAGADRDDAALDLLSAQARGLSVPGDGPMMIRDVGGPATLAIRAFGEHRYRDCVELLRPVRNRAARFGGSHAQRDLLDLTLIEAARRDGQADLANALEAERGYAKPEAASAEIWDKAA